MMNRIVLPESQGFRELRAEFEALGEARALLALLRARALWTDEARARVEACTDVDLLERWVTRAATATSLDQVFDPS